MASSTLFSKTEFYNGILLVCASGFGQDLRLPAVWGRKNFVHTKNALLLDFREYSGESSIATVHLLRKLDPVADELRHIGNFSIEAPKNNLYIGGISKQKKAVLELDSVHFTFDLLYDKKDEGLHLYIMQRP
jgi:hypothetical protein